MTINATGFILLAFYVALAKEQGADLKQLNGTIQNDIFKGVRCKGYLYLSAQTFYAHHHRYF